MTNKILHREDVDEVFRATKRPIEVEVWKFSGRYEIKTREGVLVGNGDEDFIIVGIEGEHYPIKKDIFWKTYREAYKNGG